MGIFYYGDIHIGDQDALLFCNEWAFLIMAISTMAIKTPYHFAIMGVLDSGNNRAKWQYKISVIGDIKHWRIMTIKLN